VSSYISGSLRNVPEVVKKKENMIAARVVGDFLPSWIPCVFPQEAQQRSIFSGVSLQPKMKQWIRP
jgi:hypothetical protein